ncbi:repressor LexA [candidate division WOR-3 bacterium]|nr:repressor LexA [candidate division WOR-3 bacterium]
MKSEKLSNKELEAIRHIRNSIMHKGQAPSIRELMTSMGYQSPRSISLIIDSLIKKGILQRKSDSKKLQIVKNLDDDETRAQTVDIPLVGVVACGTPILAEENIEAMFPVSTKWARPSSKYFLLRAKGDSMNEKGINDGDLVLVRQQIIADNGDIIVALIDDEATIKEFHFSGKTIVLKPRSTNEQHKPIILTRDFQIQGIVITSIPKVTEE